MRCEDIDCLADSGYGILTGFCEHCNEPWSTTTCGELFGCPKNCSFVKDRLHVLVSLTFIKCSSQWPMFSPLAPEIF
jgi:hypothetical protein